MTPTEFRAIRESLGLSKAELADLIGMSRSAITRAEVDGAGRGSLPTLMTLLGRHPRLLDDLRAAADHAATA